MKPTRRRLAELAEAAVGYVLSHGVFQPPLNDNEQKALREGFADSLDLVERTRSGK